MNSVEVLIDPGTLVVEDGISEETDGFIDSLLSIHEWVSVISSSLKRGLRDANSPWSGTDGVLTVGCGEFGIQSLYETMSKLQASFAPGGYTSVVCRDVYRELASFCSMFSAFHDSGVDSNASTTSEGFLADVYRDDMDCYVESRLELEYDILDRDTPNIVVASQQHCWKWELPPEGDDLRAQVPGTRRWYTVSQPGKAKDESIDLHVLARCLISTMGFKGSGVQPFAGLSSFARAAFPNLRFTDDIWNKGDLGTLEGDQSENARTVYDHLCVLDDNSDQLLKLNDRELEKYLSSLGVDASRENDMTRRKLRDGDSDYAKNRQRLYKGNVVQFEWHDKLVIRNGARHNRMYFINGYDDGKGPHILIGLVRLHLSIDSYKRPKL